LTAFCYSTNCTSVDAVYASIKLLIELPQSRPHFLFHGLFAGFLTRVQLACGTETAYPSRAHKFSLVLLW